MMTPQEVANCTFAKSMMGGYNMASVDDFLDKLTEDYSALYKENAALKAKLKVLVEKVEEYRATEDAMRATLLTAQRTADSLIKEAEGKRDEMLKQAETAARAGRNAQAGGDRRQGEAGGLPQRGGGVRQAPAAGTGGAPSLHRREPGPVRQAD